ncbi:hypothetical protein BM526_02475 [Alteromonas mediterranea]|jgi:hypothetical protein|uniref:hypothetical protein n=1 Tax=Alteromonas mediterranea TaxID=314275 RepID=UPI00090316B7|nr:hypothetical protein [Alteromonas mediterranea]APE00821.1 hypothetical protein BM526_02475 [Alteromonas mediterranea]
MSNFETIILGVVTGIITTVILFLLNKLITLWLLPLYQEWRYQGADVAGTWIADLNDQKDTTVKTKYSLNIIQKAHTLSGTLHFEFKSEQKNFATDFYVIGEYWEGYFTMTFKSVDRRRFSRASMVMKLVDGGGAMVGHFSFRNVVEDSVNTVALALVRS